MRICFRSYCDEFSHPRNQFRTRGKLGTVDSYLGIWSISVKFLRWNLPRHPPTCPWQIGGVPGDAADSNAHIHG